MPRYDYDNKNGFKTMTLTGQGQIVTVPDIAIIRLGVETTGEDLAAIQAQNAQITQALIDFFKDSGISDVKTYRYTIDKLYDFQNGVRTDQGFIVRNILEIRLKDMNQAGILIDGAVARGANLIDLISFEVSDPQSYYQQALNMAAINAMDKAESLAVLLGLPSVPIPVNITENAPPGIPFSQRTFVERTFTTPIEPGNLTIEANVTVEFAF